MAQKNKDDDQTISRDAWNMLVEQLEFVTSETRRLSDKILVLETRRSMLGAFGGIVVPIVVSILTALAVKLLHL